MPPTRDDIREQEAVEAEARRLEEARQWLREMQWVAKDREKESMENPDA